MPSSTPGPRGTEPLGSIAPDSGSTSFPSGGNFVDQGPIGLDGPQPGGGPSKPASSVVTLTIAADFPYPWGKPIPTQLELRHMFHSGLGDADPKFEFWEPSTEDFKAVSGATIVTADFDAFLSQIEKQAPASISRVNLISHGDQGRVGFGGTVDVQKKGVFFSSTLGLGELIATPLEARVKKTTNRFAAGGDIVFYMCNAGLDIGLLKEIADAFGVPVRGFRVSISYCPDVLETVPPKGAPTYKLIDRKKVGTSGCSGTLVADILTLTPTVAARPKPPPTP